MYGIYDARANYDIDNSICFEVCDTKKEAEENAADYGDDCVVLDMST